MKSIKTRYRWLIRVTMAMILLAAMGSSVLAGAQGSITIKSGNPDVKFHVYQVAVLTRDGHQWQSEPGAEFEQSGFALSWLKLKAEEQAAKAAAVEEYIKKEQITPSKSIKSDERMTNVEEGVYLIVKDQTTAKEIAISPFFITVPLDNSEGGYDYEVTAKPKSEQRSIIMKKKLLDGDTGDEMPLNHSYEFELSLAAQSKQSGVSWDGFPGAYETSSELYTGEIRFDKIRFSEAGQYIFEVREVHRSAGNFHQYHQSISYDPGVINVTVTVEKDEGIYKIADVSYHKDEPGSEDDIYYDEEEPDRTFVNFHLPENGLYTTAVNLMAQKTMTGRALADGEFGFVAALEWTDTSFDMKAGEAVNDASGKIVFGAIDFEQTGIYVFRITEKTEHNKRVVYDQTPFYAYVKVESNRMNKPVVTNVHYGDEYLPDPTDPQVKISNEARFVMEQGQQLPVFNNAVKGNISVKKISKAGTPLAGAVFELSYRSGDDSPWYIHGGRMTSGSDGLLNIDLPDNYAANSYQLVEISAPAGYKKSGVGVIHFKIKADGTIGTLTTTGSNGYVEVSADQIMIIVKNDKAEDDGDKDEPGTSGSNETTAPPETSGDQTNTDPTSVTEIPDNWIPYSPGDEVPEGKTVITVIGDDGVPLYYLVDEEVPQAGLARMGDTAVATVILVVVMLSALSSLLLLIYIKRKREAPMSEGRE